MSTKFESLALKPELLKNLESLEFTSMTPIQMSSLPVILDGNDIIAQAKTGSGKTAAFGLGILNKINIDNKQVQALVICPTRELAEQVAEELRRLGRMTKNLKVLVVCGGVSEYQQMSSLEHGAHIVVGTPGRVVKFLKKDFIRVNSVRFFVLDEADRMLDMGFSEDIKEISSYTPEKKQTLFFSATFPDEIEELSKKFQKNPVRLTVDSAHEENIIKEHFIEVATHAKKLEALIQIMAQFRPESTVIFCKTKQICADVTTALNRQGIYSLPFHGDLEQNERTVVLTKFSNHSCLVLVATDVAARGLDIKDLKVVINFDLAQDPEVHTHRIGRTARAGNVGLAFSLFVEGERDKLDAIKVYSKKPIKILRTEDFQKTVAFDLKAPMKTMYINGGKKDKIRPGDVLGALVGVAKLDPASVGDINILNTQTYVAIKTSDFKQALQKLEGEKIKGKKFKIGEA